MLYIQYEVFCAHQITKRLMKDFLISPGSQPMDKDCRVGLSNRRRPCRSVSSEKSKYDPLVDEVELICCEHIVRPNSPRWRTRRQSFNETSSSAERKYPTWEFCWKNWTQSPTGQREIHTRRPSCGRLTNNYRNNWYYPRKSSWIRSC